MEHLPLPPNNYWSLKIKFMKITVVGAGAVGATCADNIARKELCHELVLLDIKEGVAEGKAQDMMQAAALLGFDTRITGSTADLNAVVVGGHGDTTMIPLIRLATWNSVPVTKFLNAEQQTQIVNDTMVGGATLTKLLGTSAWYAPGATGAALVEAIVRDEKRLFTCCVSLNGEYGQRDICLGVPVIIGKIGWEKIIDFDLNADEQAAFNKSADAVRSMNDVLKTL